MPTNYDTPCAICECNYGSHYDTHDGRYSGCAACSDCEGFAEPDDNN
jgi:hypothetical protein